MSVSTCIVQVNNMWIATLLVVLGKDGAKRGEDDEGWGLGKGQGAVGKGMRWGWGWALSQGMLGGGRAGDCGERDAGRGLWGKGCREETVGKGM